MNSIVMKECNCLCVLRNFLSHNLTLNFSRLRRHCWHQEVSKRFLLVIINTKGDIYCIVLNV